MTESKTSRCESASCRKFCRNNSQHRCGGCNKLFCYDCLNEVNKRYSWYSYHYCGECYENNVEKCDECDECIDKTVGDSSKCGKCDRLYCDDCCETEFISEICEKCVRNV